VSDLDGCSQMIKTLVENSLLIQIRASQVSRIDIYPLARILQFVQEVTSPAGRVYDVFLFRLDSQ
jgi:hypothetical protein